MPWIIAACIVATLIVVFVLIRSQQHMLTSSMRLLQENFESLQRNLLLYQKEFERGEQTKASALRSELADGLQINRKEMSQGLGQASQLLETKVGLIDQKLDRRLGELTESVQSKLQQNLKEGFLHFEKVQEHLKFAGEQLQNLSAVGQSINDLNSLLKLPHLRGGFGEATLERLLSDMLPSDAFELQYRISDSTERVDAVIKYPKYVLPIDSKFPREQVLALFETTDPARLEQARKSLSEVMRALAKQIKEKYIRPDCGTTDMALLFVPSETLYFEILRSVRLCEELSRQKVFAVSPNTLAITLHAIAMAREYYEMAKGIEQTIVEVKKSQQHFDHFEKRFQETGKALRKAVDTFDMASTHLWRYSGAVTRLTGVEHVAVPNEAESTI